VEALALRTEPPSLPAGLPGRLPGEPAPPSPAGLPFGVPPKYQLVRVLGSGAMGTVLLARDRHLDRLVAIKLLREGCCVFLARLRREARLMARLVHPAIVKVHELDELAGRTYLAMEYIDGGNLALARLEPRALARTLRPVVDALALAHARGIVHRDVKPENVLLDRAGRAYLTDFGLAFDPDEGPLPGAPARPVAGTPLTMSPEQAAGVAVSPASDVFSLGSTLYRTLTGEWPFRGRTVSDVLHAILNHGARDPRALAPTIPRPLAAIVLRCLEKRPERRFGSMLELGDALDRFLAPRSVLARAGRLFLDRSDWGERREHSRFRGPRIHPEEIS